MTELRPGGEPNETLTLNKKKRSSLTAKDPDSDGEYAGNLYTNAETGETVYVTYRSLIYNEAPGDSPSYALSASITAELLMQGIRTMLVFNDEGEIWEYDITDYLTGDVGDAGGKGLPWYSDYKSMLGRFGETERTKAIYHSDLQTVPDSKKATIRDAVFSFSEQYPDTIEAEM